MRTLLGVTLFAVAMQCGAQALETDLDGNASALQASEMRPQQKVASKKQPGKPQRQRVAARS